MNNEFEKNPETVNNINDNASEFIDNKPEALSEEAASESAKEASEEEIHTEAETVSLSVSDLNNEQNEAPVNEAAPSDTKEAANDMHIQQSAVESKEEKVYLPDNETYVYSKTTPENDVVGCVWDNTDKAEKSKKKKRSGSVGFKVFTAAMLGVFTLSSATIAGFLAADYMKDNSSAALAEETETLTDIVNKYQPSSGNSSFGSANGQTTMLSTFTEIEGGLSKSQVAAKCSPSAVGIVIEQEQNYSGYSIPFFGFGDYGFPGGTQIVQGSGSGFIFTADGYIITNHHVVNGATKITVYLHDGTTAEAELVGSDALSDIAVIKIDSTDKNLVPMEIGDSSLMKVGDEVIAIGCPAGIEFMGTVTDGIISAINRDVELDNEGSMSSSTKTMTLLQTNATINRGNSGGPLINTFGQVIGINTLKLSADYEGIGFSIPMNGALPIINQLIEHGEVIERTESFVSSEGVIGISASEITKGDSEYYDIPMGVMVVQIDKDSSAAEAGLRRGDIITKFNGEAVTTVNELNRLKANFKAGDEVTISVYRDTPDNNAEFDITFKLDMAD